MNHTIKGILIVAAITSMLVLGTASMVPIMQNSFARSTNTNSNTNTADSSSSSSATAENTNNITNTATASNSQEQSACAVALTCPGGSTTLTSTPDPCPHSPYTDFVAGTGCQDGTPQTTCNPSIIGGQTATLDTDDTCRASLPAGSTDAQIATFSRECQNAPNFISLSGSGDRSAICVFGSTQDCPSPEGSTQTPTVAENGRCTIA